MQMLSILTWMMCVSTSAYLVRILLFGSNGPFESTTKFIVDNGTHVGSVCLFDYVRRIVGAYQVEEAGEGTELWRTTVRIDVFRCPKCLSFWVSFLVSVPFIIYLITTIDMRLILLSPVIHMSIVFWSQFLVFAQMKCED